MKNNIVVKDNSLINASYNLDLIEQRLILLAIIQARKSEIPITKRDKIVISALEYSNEFRVVQSGSLYQNLKNACDVLFERKFSYKEVLENGEVKFSKSRWVSKVSYIPETATIELFFTSDVLELITMLENHFTSYELEKVADLKSKYSVRLYEVLIAWRSTYQTPLISVEDIRMRLGLMANEYKTINDFKKWVIELAIKEINEKTDIQVSYEQHKHGRKIVGFTFSLKVKGGKKARSKSNEAAETLAAALVEEKTQFEVNPLFQDIADYVPLADQKTYLEQYSSEQIMAIIERAKEYCEELKQGGKKLNLGAIYRKAFAENWGQQKLAELEAERKKQETKREAEQKMREEEENNERKRQMEQEKTEEAIMLFEAMEHEEKEEILDLIEKSLNTFFLDKFRKRRAEGKAVYKEVMFAYQLKKILFDKD